jgi:hypothetical protein
LEIPQHLQYLNSSLQISLSDSGEHSLRARFREIKSRQALIPHLKDETRELKKQNEELVENEVDRCRP